MSGEYVTVVIAELPLTEVSACRSGLMCCQSVAEIGGLHRRRHRGAEIEPRRHSRHRQRERPDPHRAAGVNLRGVEPDHRVAVRVADIAEKHLVAV